jgi:hypothetical protein
MITKAHTQKVSGALAVLALAAAVGSCDAVQPKPLCKPRPSKYAAKYFSQGNLPAACAAKKMTGELLYLQYYLPKRDDPKDLPKIAIEPASVVKALEAGEEAGVDVKAEPEYSLGKFSSVRPGDDDMCFAKTLADTSVSVPAIPADPAKMRAAAPATSLTYTWSNVKMIVHPLSNGIHFGADLVRKDGDCSITYKVSAVYPAVYCGDGTKPKVDDDGKPVVDAMGKPVLTDDPTKGKAKPDGCDPVQGSGLSPDITYDCDISADGKSGTHLCLPKDQFPSLKKQ